MKPTLQVITKKKPTLQVTMKPKPTLQVTPKAHLNPAAMDPSRMAASPASAALAMASGNNRKSPNRFLNALQAMKNTQG